MELWKILIIILISVAASFFLSIRIMLLGIKRYAVKDAEENKELLDFVADRFTKQSKVNTDLESRIKVLEKKVK